MCTFSSIFANVFSHRSYKSKHTGGTHFFALFFIISKSVCRLNANTDILSEHDGIFIVAAIKTPHHPVPVFLLHSLGLSDT